MSRFEKGHQKINKTAKKGSKVEKKIIAFFWDTLEFLTGWTKFHVEALCTLLSSGLAILLPACGNNDAGEGQNCEMIINDHIIFSNYLFLQQFARSPSSPHWRNSPACLVVRGQAWSPQRRSSSTVPLLRPANRHGKIRNISTNYFLPQENSTQKAFKNAINLSESSKKKQVFYGQADHKRCPPAPPYGQLFVIFWCNFDLILWLYVFWNTTNKRIGLGGKVGLL